MNEYFTVELVTQRDLIRSVAARWRGQYPPDKHPDPRRVGVLAKLEALDLETASPADVERIIGNDSWAKNACGRCEVGSDRLVRINDGDSSISLCRSCLFYIDGFLRGTEVPTGSEVQS